MKISKVVHLKNGFYDVFIDNEKYKLTDETLIKYGIFKPGEYNISMQDLVSYNDEQMGYIIAIKYLSNHLRTEKEVCDKLKKENIKVSLIDKIIIRLKKEKYLNNSNYIKSYINDQILLSMHGPKKIKNELLKKGLKQDLIDDELSLISDEVWNEKIEKLISKKIKSYSGSKLMLILKLKSEIINQGYSEKYLSYVNDINYNEEMSFKKDYDKYKKLLSKKYKDEKLEFELEKKLYSLGYRK